MNRRSVQSQPRRRSQQGPQHAQGSVDYQPTLPADGPVDQKGSSADNEDCRGGHRFGRKAIQAGDGKSGSSEAQHVVGEGSGEGSGLVGRDVAFVGLVVSRSSAASSLGISPNARVVGAMSGEASDRSINTVSNSSGDDVSSNHPLDQAPLDPTLHPRRSAARSPRAKLSNSK